MEFNIVMVGCGGTGGCFFGRFIRFLADFYDTDTTIKFAVIDGDAVEPKNLGRQPFVTEDIGENKAVSLASAAEEALGVKVKAYPLYLSDANYTKLLAEMGGYNQEKVNILIGAVDNHACRKLMHKWFQENRGPETIYYIDSANEFESGDVVIGKKAKGKIIAPDRCHYFPEVLADAEKPVYEKSCEELNVSAPQHLATNSLAADIIFSYVVQLIQAGPGALIAPAGIVHFNPFLFFSRFDKYEEAVHGKIK